MNRRASWCAVLVGSSCLLAVASARSSKDGFTLGQEADVVVPVSRADYDPDEVEPTMGGGVLFSLYQPSFEGHRQWYDQYFRHGEQLLVEGSYWYYFYTGPVYVSAFASLGFWQEYGKSQRCLDASGAYIDCNRPEVASYQAGNDPTSFNLIPAAVGIEVKGTWLKTAFGIPLVPYCRGSLLYTLWWVWSGGQLSQNPADQYGVGGVYGVSGSVGLAFNLDVIDPITSHEAYRSWGMIDVYLYGQYTWARQDSFSASSMDLSAQYWKFGLAIDF